MYNNMALLDNSERKRHVDVGLLADNIVMLMIPDYSF
jgi:hypothetical protein